MSPFRRLLWTLISATLIHLSTSNCNRKPQGAKDTPSPVDEKYKILIAGNPTTYLPRQKYNLTLSCSMGLKFISFTLIVEAENASLITDNKMLGQFEIIDNAETRFSSQCENMIESSNNNIKHTVVVSWTAPDTPDAGCILFKAAVLQHRDVWFADDGFLTKRLCPEETDDSQTLPVNPCCACDEAKYEVVLERIWTKNTHAKYFPSEPRRTTLGSVIGASHSLEYTFWNYGESASDGLISLAEHGETSVLEREIKEHAKDGTIRTIIKAPGIKFKDNLVMKTMATVRVGPKHHMISLVSKINPSPDWILGVASLELCLANCTWLDKKVISLYPWDVGTDSGPSYMSPDEAQRPPDVVRRITSSFPNDERSPFYDRDGGQMTPLAKLHVTKKRAYGRCLDDYGTTVNVECATHPWNEWSNCTVKCGTGDRFRTRSYKNEAAAKNFNCNMKLYQSEKCTGQCILSMMGNDDQFQQSSDARYSSAECQLSPWSEFTECSNNCGRGTKTRQRDFVNSYSRDKCQSASRVSLVDTQPCEGVICGGNIRPSNYDNNDKYFGGNIEPDYNNWQTDNSNNRNSWSTGESDQQPDSDYGQLDTSDPARSRNYNEQYPNENVNNIYGSDKLVGNSPQSFYSDNNQQFTGDLISSYGYDKRPNLNTRPSRKPYQNQYDQSFNSRPDGYETPGRRVTTVRPFRNYGLGNYNTGNSYNKFNTQTNNRDPNAPDTSFCLEKPVVSLEPCNTKRIVNRNYWFFDADDGECKLFTTDNCDLNKNKFFKLEECVETCGGGQQISWSDNYGGDNVDQDYGNVGTYGQARYDARRSWN